MFYSLVVSKICQTYQNQNHNTPWDNWFSISFICEDKFLTSFEISRGEIWVVVSVASVIFCEVVISSVVAFVVFSTSVNAKYQIHENSIEICYMCMHIKIYILLS